MHFGPLSKYPPVASLYNHLNWQREVKPTYVEETTARM